MMVCENALRAFSHTIIRLWRGAAQPRERPERER